MGGTQCRTENWQIQKYHVENGQNTDTTFMIGDAYLTLYPSRVFFLSQGCIHQKSTSAIARKHEKILNRLVKQLKSQVIGCPTNFIIE